jgi:GNAT superfamily N-acetyltransferase
MDTSVVVTAIESPTGDQIAQLAVLFDDYRVHHGELPDIAQSSAWLQENIGGGALNVFVAEIDGDLVGFGTIVRTPASLRLGHYWQIRDLFVPPRWRRTGIARALLARVRQEAEAAGALRLALQTEEDNAAALRLYRTSGFVEVEGLNSLVMSLPPAT